MIIDIRQESVKSGPCYGIFKLSVIVKTDFKIGIDGVPVLFNELNKGKDKLIKLLVLC